MTTTLQYNERGTVTAVTLASVLLCSMHLQETNQHVHAVYLLFTFPSDTVGRSRVSFSTNENLSVTQKYVDRSQLQVTFLHRLGVSDCLRSEGTGEEEEEDGEEVPGGLPGIRHLLFLLSEFYLFKAFIHNPPALCPCRAAHNLSSSEDVAVAAVGKVVPPHPDCLMVLVRHPLGGALLQRGER